MQISVDVSVKFDAGRRKFARLCCQLVPPAGARAEPEQKSQSRARAEPEKSQSRARADLNSKSLLIAWRGKNERVRFEQGSKRPLKGPYNKKCSKGLFDVFQFKAFQRFYTDF